MTNLAFSLPVIFYKHLKNDSMESKHIDIFIMFNLILIRVIVACFIRFYIIALKYQFVI